MGCVCNLLTCACCNCYLPQRWLGTILCTCVIVIHYCMRICISMTIVRMIKPPPYNNKTVSASGCPLRGQGEDKSDVTYGVNEWSENIQGWLISSFYIGYIIFHIPAGYFCDRYGSRWVLSIGILLCAVCTALIPAAVDYLSWEYVLVLRICQGLAQGSLYPGVTSYLSRWVPSHERALLGSIAYSGTAEGCIIGTLVTGYLMDYFNNWHIVFYFWAISGVLLFIFMFIYMYSDYDASPCITEEEKLQLSQYLKKQGRKKAPYTKILRDPVMIGIIIGQCGHNILIFLLVGNLPKYMDNVLNYTVKENAIASSLPYIAQWVASVVTGKLADYGIKIKLWDIGCTRKLFTIVAAFVPSVCLIGVAYVGCDHIFAILLFTLALLFTGPFFSGLKINVIDVTTQYGGASMAFSNGIGSFSGLAAPHICAQIAPDNTLEQWKRVYATIFAIALICALIYICMASSKRRRWDYPLEDQKYFVGSKPGCFRCKDGIDKDAELVRVGRQADGLPARE